VWNLRRKRRMKRGSKKLRKGRRPGLRLKGYQAAGCHKKRMVKMTFRMSRQPRGEAAKRIRGKGRQMSTSSITMYVAGAEAIFMARFNLSVMEDTVAPGSKTHDNTEVKTQEVAKSRGQRCGKHRVADIEGL